MKNKTSFAKVAKERKTEDYLNSTYSTYLFTHIQHDNLTAICLLLQPTTPCCNLERNAHEKCRNYPTGST